MSAPSAIRTGRRLVRWAAFAAGWAAAALLFFAIQYAGIQARGRPLPFPIPWTRVLFVSCLMTAVWALLSLPVAALARRFRLVGGPVLPGLGVHLVTASVFAVLHSAAVVAVRTALNNYPGGPQPFARPFAGLLGQMFVENLLVYALIVAAVTAADTYREYRRRKLRAAHLEGQLARAQLDVLRMQLQPHFLFNTLHGISALMETDVPAARRMIARLSDLLRLSLQDDSGAPEIPLREEVEFLERYLDIQKMLFGERLQITRDIEPVAAGLFVPRLLLQPLVENALRHGIARQAGPGHLCIAARRIGAHLHLTVKDNGPGLPAEGAGSPPREGLGLSNTRARLEHLYGDAHTFTLTDAPEGGAVATLLLPARTRPTPEPAL